LKGNILASASKRIKEFKRIELWTDVCIHSAMILVGEISRDFIGFVQETFVDDTPYYEDSF